MLSSAQRSEFCFKLREPPTFARLVASYFSAINSFYQEPGQPVSDTEKSETEAREHGGLAQDVAHLYSFAQAGDVPYRVFAKTPKPRAAAGQHTEVSEPPAAAQSPASTAAAAQTAQTAQAESEPVQSAQAGSAQAEEVKPAISRSQPEPVPAPPAPVQPIWSEPHAGRGTAIAIASIAGGVGKTTIAANLGRILSAHNESVLLVDATGSSLLPFYFGACDLHSGMRTFLAPEPGMPPIRILGAERVTHEWLENEVKPAMQTAQRTIFDLGPASHSLLPEILPLCAMILIPLVADMNSILSIPRTEAHNRAMHDLGLTLPLPLYVSNKWDETSERERKGRELIAREVGDRLLPISIRRSPEVADAVAERMTVADYAPESEIAQDFAQLALWIKKAIPVTETASHLGRWSEA